MHADGMEISLYPLKDEEMTSFMQIIIIFTVKKEQFSVTHGQALAQNCDRIIKLNDRRIKNGKCS
jgi:predicted ABC-type transport system involved in lysophospholipase L1 biosynthesis ATPase subunit